MHAKPYPSATCALRPGLAALTMLLLAACGIGTADGDRAPPPSTDASLAALTLEPGALDQVFQAAQTDYTASVGVLADSTRVTATTRDPGAGIRIDGRAVASGAPGAAIDLSTGTASTLIEVTAEDRVTTRSYRIDISRQDIAAFAQAGYLKASNTDAGDRFGTTLALSGGRLAIGAPAEASAANGVDGNEDDDSAGEAGAVYLFERDDRGAWIQAAYLKASNSEAFDGFGAALALDGDRLVVGAPGEASAGFGVDSDQTDNSAGNAGAAYVFERDGSGRWRQVAYLKAGNTGAGDRFGAAVALSGDRIAVGAPAEASAGFGLNADPFDDFAAEAGAVYVFARDGGGDWAQEVYLKASNTNAFDAFGSSVALDDDSLAVGAPGEASIATGVGGNQADNTAGDAGAVYLFTRTAGIWSQQAYLKASNTDAADGFGKALALRGDRLVVGAPGEASATGVQGNDTAPGAGAAYLFMRNNSGVWTQGQYLKAPNADAGDGFGTSLALAGQAIAIGAPREASNATGIDGDATDDTAGDAGAAYLFLDDGASFLIRAYVKASNTDAGDAFGSALALESESLVIGAPGEASAATGPGGNSADDTAGDAGAVFTFR
ncbi:MAG: cadherin-like beta sandwich domain-containing protein [Pseudomonadales bacterium]|jgi:hypothetical protein|nr:cadherin-like beta sandwich domain-containing protein [Pseudomonadales bacterium]